MRSPKKSKAIEHMTLEELTELNDLYLEHPSLDLPFSQIEIAEEIFRREGSVAHMEDLRKRLESEIPPYPAPKNRRFNFRRALPVAMVIVLVIALGGAAVAGLPNLFNFSREGDTTIYQGNSGEMTLRDSSSEYTSLHEALEAYHYTGVSPQWIPDRFSLEFVTADELVGVVNIVAWYTDADGSGFSIIVGIYEEEAVDTITGVLEIDDRDNEEFVAGGITHYINSNYGLRTAIWEYGSSVVTLTGELSEIEIKAIIESIYK